MVSTLSHLSSLSPYYLSKLLSLSLVLIDLAGLVASELQGSTCVEACHCAGCFRKRKGSKLKFVTLLT